MGKLFRIKIKFILFCCNAFNCCFLSFYVFNQKTIKRTLDVCLGKFLFILLFVTVLHQRSTLDKCKCFFIFVVFKNLFWNNCSHYSLFCYFFYAGVFTSKRIKTSILYSTHNSFYSLCDDYVGKKLWRVHNSFANILCFRSYSNRFWDLHSFKIPFKQGQRCLCNSYWVFSGLCNGNRGFCCSYYF